jgi:transposase
MMGRQEADQGQLFYLFNLERRIPSDHLLRRINPVVAQIMLEVRERLAPFYSDIGRPSIDPELLIRMLIVGYCYGIRSERQLCQEVELHLAYRWFCRLDLEDPVPDHSTFSVNRHGRFRASDSLRQVFEAVVRTCMNAGLVKGEGFAADASVMEADASRYHGKAPDEIDWSLPQRQTRAVAEFLSALEAVSSVGRKSAGLKTQTLLSPLEHHLGRCHLVVTPGWSRFHINDHGVLNIDQVIEPVAELHALVGLGCPGRARIDWRDHLRGLAISTSFIVACEGTAASYSGKRYPPG